MKTWFLTWNSPPFQDKLQKSTIALPSTIPNKKPLTKKLLALVPIENNSISNKVFFSLSPGVVYKVCFAFITGRSVGSIIIEYNAETRFNHEIGQVKIPETLLKSEDFKNTYSYAENMHALTMTSLDFQKDRRMKEDAIYSENKKYIDTLFWVSLIEISVIVLTGVYQFFSVRSFLINKQYLWTNMHESLLWKGMAENKWSIRLFIIGID